MISRRLFLIATAGTASSLVVPPSQAQIDDDLLMALQYPDLGAIRVPALLM
jgi:hypothetical protein